MTMPTNEQQPQQQRRRQYNIRHQHPQTSSLYQPVVACRFCRRSQLQSHVSHLVYVVVLLLSTQLVSFTTALHNTDGSTTIYHRSQQQEQQIPVIGILSQPSKKLDHSYHYIATSYVDWIEQRQENSTTEAAAITIPIPYDASPELLDELFEQMNGLLLPGGWNGYMPPSVPYLLDKIMESNNNGMYFPVWGTCLGYEFLIKYIGGIDAIQSGFDLYNSSIPLEDVQVRELYNDTTIFDVVTTLPVTLNNHQLGIEPQHFLSNKKLTDVWEITSMNYDANGRPFVSSIEPKDPMSFPIYGVQYHPEKNAYEYTTYPNTNIPYENIDHSDEGIDFSYYLSNFFLEKVRYGMQYGNQHQYTKRNTYPPIRTYTSSTGVKYEDIYIIPYASHWINDNYDVTSNSNNQTIITSSSNIINISTTGMIQQQQQQQVTMTTPKLKIIQRNIKNNETTTTTITETNNSSSNDDNDNESESQVPLLLLETKQDIVDTISTATTTTATAANMMLMVQSTA